MFRNKMEIYRSFPYAVQGNPKPMDCQDQKDGLAEMENILKISIPQTDMKYNFKKYKKVSSHRRESKRADRYSHKRTYYKEKCSCITKNKEYFKFREDQIYVEEREQQEHLHSGRACCRRKIGPVRTEREETGDKEDKSQDNYREKHKHDESPMMLIFSDFSSSYDKSELSTDDSSVNYRNKSWHQATQESTTDSSSENLSDSDIKSLEDPPHYNPAIQGCRIVDEFQYLHHIGEGTCGIVSKARNKRTGEIVAVKKLKLEKEQEDLSITVLREINILSNTDHKNIVKIREIVVNNNISAFFIVMEYVEHNLSSVIKEMRHKKQSLIPGEVKCLLKQLLKAVAYLHDNWIMHRDLKPSNLLLTSTGILKVGDFGSARAYGYPLLKVFTPYIITLWYRAPELLLYTNQYSTPVDMWSIGCIFAELLLMNVLFPGETELDQLNWIFSILGTPDEKKWPDFNNMPTVRRFKFKQYPISNLHSKFSSLSEVGLNLLIKILTYDPEQRLTAEDGLKHAYFDELPVPIDPAKFALLLVKDKKHKNESSWTLI